GTLYGRNAIGGAMNILYKEPTPEFEAAIKGIVGNYGTQEAYGMMSGPLTDTISARVNFSYRERDGVIDEIGDSHSDIDSIDTDNVAIQFKWQVADNVEANIRANWMETDRVFGGANGGGVVVLNEQNNPYRNTTDLVPGFRKVDTGQTNPFARDFFDPNQRLLEFTNPFTGATDLAQPLRPGMDHYGANPGVIAAPNLNGFQNAAAVISGKYDVGSGVGSPYSYGYTTAQDAAKYNGCVTGNGSLSGEDICAATSGLNWENFDQNGVQFNLSWDVNEDLQLKYIYGYNTLMYQRITDDDLTDSAYLDRQFYVNHEADYSSHEFQAFYDLTDSISVTSGIFFYDATIDQRGDFYSSVNNARMVDAYEDKTALSAAAANAIGAPGLEGISASALAFGAGEAARVAAGDYAAVDLYSAKRMCEINGAASCARNYAVNNAANNNLQTSRWYGDDGSNRRLNVQAGPSSMATDLLYATQTEREAFAAYTQGVWDINEKFTLTLGIRYAEDEVTAEENLWRYSETGALNAVGNPGFLGLYGGLRAVNVINGGLIEVPVTEDNPYGHIVTEKVTNNGIPFALSVYRPFKRSDEEFTGRINLDWNLTDDAMMYFSATSGYRSGGYSLVYFSQTPTYEPEELIAYEIGYKTQWFDGTLQLNGSFYYYDYETIHTFATEVSEIGGTSTSVLEAPGAEIVGVEAEVMWLATDSLTLGGNFSYTPSEYTESLRMANPSNFEAPPSLYPEFEAITQDIKGNQLLQVPEGKVSMWASYRYPLTRGSNLELFGNWSWTDDVYFSAFESEDSMAPDYARLDLRATWTSADEQWIVSGFVNNVLDEVGVLHIAEGGEALMFRVPSQTTVPRAYGLELTYQLGGR
ncbi:MAG: TonB-dependent receptor domain-containing protein, partial [Pseudomonadales bacterium]